MPDDKFDEFLRRETNRYTEQVTPPADAIWAAIEQDVARAIAAPDAQPEMDDTRRATRDTRWIWIGVGLGLAAALVIGVRVGRWSASRETPRPAVVAAGHESADDSARAAELARASVARHLADAEVFLTAVKADLATGRPDSDRAARSRELLARTRLLLSSNEPRSPAVDVLLQDLELLLAEISALPVDRHSLDQRLIEERLRQGTILPRIRTTIPARTAGL